MYQLIRWRCVLFIYFFVFFWPQLHKQTVGFVSSCQRLSHIPAKATSCWTDVSQMMLPAAWTDLCFRRTPVQINNKPIGCLSESDESKTNLLGSFPSRKVFFFSPFRLKCWVNASVWRQRKDMWNAGVATAMRALWLLLLSRKEDRRSALVSLMLVCKGWASVTPWKSEGFSCVFIDP